MSYLSPGDKFSNHSGLHEDDEPGEGDVHTDTALSNAKANDVQSSTPSDVPPFLDEGPSHSAPENPSPVLKMSQHTSHVEKQDGISHIGSGSHNSDGGGTIPFEERRTHSSSTSNNLQRLADAQQQPLTPTLTAGTNLSTLKGSASRARSPAAWLKKECEELRRNQESAHMNVDGSPRTPEQADFPTLLSMTILPPTAEPVEHCVVLLHHSRADEKSFNNLAKRLQSNLAEGAFILMRGLRAVSEGNSGYHWADSDEWDSGFIHTSRMILEDVVRDGLMAKCSFQPQNIVILGHGQGGMVALAAAATWHGIELGGVISIGGSMPTYTQLESNVKAKTPALILGGALGEMNAAALQQIQENFISADDHIQHGAHDMIPESQEQLKQLWAFFAHRLRREEWKQQAVISFDGGGVRGYGSLLILQDLMNKIGDLEKSLGGPEAESSFAPRDYRPTANKLLHTDTGSTTSLRSGPTSPVEPDEVGPTPTNGLPNSSLFLPCHYFNYAAGTSTGGLIAIMLSRLRMTVDDCIKEYKALGDKIFGHPRLIPTGGMMWHKLDCKHFERVIRDVTARYSERSQFESHYSMDRMDQDMCQCIVLAYADNIGGDAPYLFRTYPTPAAPLDRSRSRVRSRQQTLRNYGDAHGLPIWQVARATSAAPGYFPPIKIRKGNGPEVVTFKDGGFGSNNPSEEAYHDIVHRHGGVMKNMGPFISIGTGFIPLNMFPGKKRNLRNLRNTIANLKTAAKLPSRTAKAHEGMVRWSTADNEDRFPYYRFDGGKRLGEVGLGEWKGHKCAAITGRDKIPGCKTLEKIETAAAVYLQRRDVQRDLMEVARILVERRRLQTRNASDWDRYASFSYYECDFKGCQKQRINTAQEIKEHIRRTHRTIVDDQVLENQIKDKRRVHWVYRLKTPDPNAAAKAKGKSTA